MHTAITNDLKISVEVAYHPNNNVQDNEHVFAYRITISNYSEHTLKLLRRHWFITDLNVTKNEVEGEGVVGVQPLLEPGETYQYVSGCAIQAEIGTMYGTYLMERQLDGKQFKVAIPKFNLIAEHRLN